MITTKTLKTRWAHFKNRYDMARRTVTNRGTAEDMVAMALEKVRLETVAQLERESLETADTFHNWLITQRQAACGRANPDRYPPGDKRPRLHRGHAEAYTAVIAKWDEMNENGDSQ